MNGIAREIKQSKPFRTVQQEAVVALFRTADQLRRTMAGALEGHDLTLQQYNVLRILRGAAPDALPTLEIGERMIEQAPGVTRLLDRMEARGWVARERCEQDRRQVLCRITSDGRELLDELERPVEHAAEQALGGLAAHDLQELLRILDQVRNS